MPDGRLNYVELPCADVPAARAFYEAAFGWTVMPFGDDYAATTTGDVDLGLNGDPDQQTAAPLAVIQVSDLEAAQARIEAAGGVMTLPIFAFPGGRRFHVRDPGGSEIAVMQPD
ncbi:Glyoxalase/bleomycin resistance/extradiol dioxygenase family protein [Sphingomonas antarctica]|uniref:VOC family protein n=1 Tax=Sphingomonas antarctica TaxID=2040274 RepID=UPI0039E759F0